VTYASGRYERSRTRLVSSAKKFGIDKSWSFSPEDFKETEVYKQNKDVVSVYRGAGLWLWKPYYISQVLEELGDDDYLVYLDAGIEIIAELSPLLNLCQGNRGTAFFKVHDHLNGAWTKRDCFVYMDCDDSNFYDTEQNMSGILVFRKNKMVKKLLSEWFYYCSDIRIVSDNENTCGLPNVNGFVENRHDQSILTNLRIKYGLDVFTDPTQLGNDYRKYAREDLDNYPQLLNLHRERLPSWRKALKLIFSDPKTFIQGSLIHLRRLLKNLFNKV